MSQFNPPAAFIPNPNAFAHMGYIGSVQLSNLPGVFSNPIIIRVSSCDIKASQDISYPEVIDGRIDQTIYQVNPILVGGTMAFPLTHEDVLWGCPSSNVLPPIVNSIAAALWQIAVARDDIGRMYYVFNADIRYSDNTAFTYQGCMANSLTFTITQSAPINMSMEVWGGAVPVGQPVRGTSIGNYAGQNTINFLSPARVVTWNDAVVELYTTNGLSILHGAELTSFEAKVENNLERVFSLNGSLSVQDIVPKKRKLTGSLKVLGMNSTLDNIAYTNSQNYTSQAAIAVGYSQGNSGSGASAYWATAFNGVVFKIETMALSMGVFETTTEWTALASCNRNYLATSFGGSMPLSPTLTYPIQSSTATDYGGSTLPTLGNSNPAVAFPAFTQNGQF